MANGKAGAPLGNLNGAKSKLFMDELRRHIAQDKLTLPEKRQRLYQAAGKLLTLASLGEEWAIKELANRTDGKSIQGVELSGPEGGAVNFFDAATLRGMAPKKVAQLQGLLKEAGAMIDKDGQK